LGEDEADAAIVRSTVALGHALGLRVVAEGVEDEEVWRALGKMGCDVVQGYYVCRPLSASRFRRWLCDAMQAMGHAVKGDSAELSRSSFG